MKRRWRRADKKGLILAFAAQFFAFSVLSTGTYLIGQHIGALAAQIPNYAPPVGALNPQVTQSNISVTICRPGWTRTIRPPVRYTNALKLKQMKERHLLGAPSSYELDHLIALELGGHPTNLLNLWPQLWSEARIKDKWETALNRAVCALRMTLRSAQEKIKNPATWH